MILKSVFLKGISASRKMEYFSEIQLKTQALFTKPTRKH
jgi:hypothetical protein